MAKTFAFGTPEAQTISYIYEDTTSRLKSMTDALGQTTNYQYESDDNLSQVTYTGAQNPTPNLAYAYDPYYNRIASVASSGSGVINGTIGYDYYPVTLNPPTLGANRVSTVTGILGDTITYSYDELGRVHIQSVDGNSNVSSMEYDSLNRPGTSVNPLGTFTRAYDLDVTPRLGTLTYPNGQTANYTYFDNNNDRRLETLENLTSGPANISRFGYTYDPEGAIQTQNKTLATNETDLAFGYDSAQQLTSVSQGTLHFLYEYDAAGNRVSDLFSAQFSHGGNTYTANNLNQLDTVTKDPGAGGPALGPFSLTYDANGNMTYDGDNQTYEWDAANRLVAINYIDTNNRTEFAYDGLGRRVKITEYGPGVTATVQPGGTRYVPFSSAPISLPAGEYTLTFEGLNPLGGNNTALVDMVILGEPLQSGGGMEIEGEDPVGLVPSGSFENPDVSSSTGGYLVNPNGDTVWSYTGVAGIAANGSDLTSDNSGAPHGNQVGFIANNGLISQIWNMETPGTYALSFMVAQRATGNDSYQRLRVSLRPSSAASSAKTFIWSGNTIAEERDSTGTTVKKRFFAEGEQRIGGKDEGLYYYSRDHLDSIREVTNENGDPVAQYDYDAWGNRVTLTGNPNFDFGFTGHYFHQPSGMNFTRTREYNPPFARWMSRDPIGEAGGVNLYNYVANNPINTIDSLGLYYRDYSAGETQAIFLNAAFSAATAGSTLGLLNIAYNSRAYGPYDFSLRQYEGDTFCVHGRQYNPNEFANYIAGYQGAAYDEYVPSPVPALVLVNSAGIYYHLRGSTKAQNDPWDATGRPDIAAGAAGVPSSGIWGILIHLLFPKP